MSEGLVTVGSFDHASGKVPPSPPPPHVLPSFFGRSPPHTHTLENPTMYPELTEAHSEFLNL